MRRFAQLIGAGTLALALLTGASFALVARAEEVTIQGGGYIGYTSGVPSSSSGGDASSSTPGGSSSGMGGGGSSSSDGGNGGGDNGSSSSSSPSTGTPGEPGTTAPDPEPGTTPGAGAGGGTGASSSRPATGGTAGTSTPTGNASSSGAVESEPEVESTPEEETEEPETSTTTELETITDSGVPLGSLTSREGWGLANLLLALAVLASGVVLCIRTRLHGAGRKAPYLVGAAGLLPAVLFAALENFGRMQLLSRWTPLFIGMTIAYIIAAAAVQYKQRAAGQ